MPPQQAADWRQTDESLTIAVNLSARQLRSTSIVDDVRTALALSGLDPHGLVLEITESVLMDDVASAITLIDEFKSLGITLASDDFGTGYSSLRYIQQFKFDILKIDKSFVDALARNPDQGATIIRTIVTLGQTLGMQIVAGGIETIDQYRTLTELECNSGQGYLTSKPLDPDDALAFITHSRGSLDRSLQTHHL